MSASKLFTFRNNLIAFAIAASCAFGIRHGISNEFYKSAAHEATSEWIDKSWESRLDAKAELAGAHLDVYSSQQQNDNKLEAIAHAKITEITQILRDENSHESHQLVIDLLSARARSMDNHLFSHPHDRIFLWAIIGLSAFFILLSSLRFTLK